MVVQSAALPVVVDGAASMRPVVDPSCLRRRGVGANGAAALARHNAFMKAEVARIKRAQAGVSHQDAFQQATSNWHTSSANPKNQAAPADDVAAAAGDAAGALAEDDPMGDAR